MSIILQYCRILKNPLLAWQDQSSQLYIQLVTSDSDDVWTGSSNHTCWRRPWRATETRLLSLCLLPTVRHFDSQASVDPQQVIARRASTAKPWLQSQDHWTPRIMCKTFHAFILFMELSCWLSVACLPSAWLSQGCNQLLFSKMLFLNILVIGPSVENWTT